MSLTFGWDGDIDITGKFKKNGVEISTGNDSGESTNSSKSLLTILDLGFEMGVSVTDICKSMKEGQMYDIVFFPDGMEILDTPVLIDKAAPGILHIARIDEISWHLSIETPFISYLGELASDTEGTDIVNWIEIYNSDNRTIYTNKDQISTELAKPWTMSQFIDEILSERAQVHMWASGAEIQGIPGDGYLAVVKDGMNMPTVTFASGYGEIYVYNLMNDKWVKAITLDDLGMDLYAELNADNNYMMEILPQDLEDYSRFHFELTAYPQEDTTQGGQVCIWSGDIDINYLVQDNKHFKTTFIDNGRTPQFIDIYYHSDSVSLIMEPIQQASGYFHLELRAYVLK